MKFEHWPLGSKQKQIFKAFLRKERKDQKKKPCSKRDSNPGRLNSESDALPLGATKKSHRKKSKR